MSVATGNTASFDILGTGVCRERNDGNRSRTPLVLDHAYGAGRSQAIHHGIRTSISTKSKSALANQSTAALPSSAKVSSYGFLSGIPEPEGGCRANPLQ